uniref:M-phase specific PLK1 interacting protein n=1 Tax=Gasterosteus aculeatus aculeatus TaxID=481459 RepID=G3ND97_GASAC
MYRGPDRPQWSPGAPRPTDRFPSPAPRWGFPGLRSPYGGSGSCYESPLRSPGSQRGFGYGDGSGSRGFGGSKRPRGGSCVCFQAESSVEKYFSRSMLQDPWEALQPASDGRPERNQRGVTTD